MKRNVRREWSCLGIVVLLGLALRLYQLSAQSLWRDEAFRWLVASLPLAAGLECTLIDFPSCALLPGAVGGDDDNLAKRAVGAHEFLDAVRHKGRRFTPSPSTASWRPDS